MVLILSGRLKITPFYFKINNNNNNVTGIKI